MWYVVPRNTLDIYNEPQKKSKQEFIFSPSINDFTPQTYSVMQRYIHPAVPAIRRIVAYPLKYGPSGPINILLVAYGSIPQITVFQVALQVNIHYPPFQSRSFGMFSKNYFCLFCIQPETNKKMLAVMKIIEKTVSSFIFIK